MKKIILQLTACFFFIIAKTVLCSTVFSQTATMPAAVNGSEETPYEISSLENLYWISQNADNWDKHYVQTADINAAETVTWYDSL